MANDLQSFVIAATRYSRKIGKKKMGAWTTSFTIGITRPFTSDNINHLTNIVIPQSTYCTGRRQRFPTTSFGDLRAANYTIPAFEFRVRFELTRTQGHRFCRPTYSTTLASEHFQYFKEQKNPRTYWFEGLILVLTLSYPKSVF